MGRRTIDRERLITLYRDEGLALTECAKQVGCSLAGAYNALLHMGIPIRDKGSGRRGKGKARFLMSTGYWAVYDSRRAGTSYSEQLEHRLIVEKRIGRPLRPGEVVHHRNGIRSDNRDENLELISDNSVHMHERHANRGGWHRYGKCITCGTTERRYGAHGLCIRCYNRRFTKRK